jgi:GH15 family glucan-1,4-alpha-glucosidase
MMPSRITQPSAPLLGVSSQAGSYPPIGDYAVIGDLRTIALVGRGGSIDFMCFPKYDSPSIFAALLDEKRGGRFLLAPMLEDAKHIQLYLPDTNVLLTRFLSAEGVAEVSDFMPLAEGGEAQAVVRRAKTVRGKVRYRMICEPRFDYGRADHDVVLRPGEAVFSSHGPNGLALLLRTRAPLRIVDGTVVSEFVLGAGESLSFVLEEAHPELASMCPVAESTAELFKTTINYWRRWTGESTYQGRWREMVSRSALTLKLLTARDHGAIVASPTFGLPEDIGGERNWDYRYCWIRDASFLIYAMMRLGHTGEARAFMNWIEARCNELNPDGSLQILYGLDGRHDLPEETLSHLEGYRGSRPVRIGNAAVGQLQLDIYGELLDSVYLYNKYGEPISYNLWRNMVHLVNWLCRHWQEADEGIWEVRGGRKEFVHSRLMCWVALDRAIRIARDRSFPGPLTHWRRVRDAIYGDIIENFWDRERQLFVQYKGSHEVGASVLLMPLVKFISPRDPLWLSTLRAVERDLVDDSLVYRYRIGDSPVDGLRGGEGTFSMCSFWFVECISRSGDLEKARFFFEKMLGYANHVGLYGEELGPSGEHLGNFPQAFTHLSLISAAYDLNRRLSESGHRA